MADQLILIIEDNERNLKLVRDVLQFSGFRTAEARTAEDGLALASASPPDLVLLDLQLPGIDGIEAFRQLRGSPQTAARFFQHMAQVAFKRLRDSSDLVAEVTRWGLEATGLDVEHK